MKTKGPHRFSAIAVAAVWVADRAGWITFVDKNRVRHYLREAGARHLPTNLPSLHLLFARLRLPELLGRMMSLDSSKFGHRLRERKRHSMRKSESLQRAAEASERRAAEAERHSERLGAQLLERSREANAAQRKSESLQRAADALVGMAREDVRILSFAKELLSCKGPDRIPTANAIREMINHDINLLPTTAVIQFTYEVLKAEILDVLGKNSGVNIVVVLWKRDVSKDGNVQLQYAGSCGPDHPQSHVLDQMSETLDVASHLASPEAMLLNRDANDFVIADVGEAIRQHSQLGFLDGWPGSEVAEREIKSVFAAKIAEPAPREGPETAAIMSIYANRPGLFADDEIVEIVRQTFERHFLVLVRECLRLSVNRSVSKCLDAVTQTRDVV